MNEQQIEQERDRLFQEYNRTGDALNEFLKPYKLPDGRVGDNVRKMPAYNRLNYDFRVAFANYRAFNARYKPKPRRPRYLDCTITREAR